MPGTVLLLSALLMAPAGGQDVTWKTVRTAPLGAQDNPTAGQVLVKKRHIAGYIFVKVENPTAASVEVSLLTDVRYRGRGWQPCVGKVRTLVVAAHSYKKMRVEHATVYDADLFEDSRVVVMSARASHNRDGPARNHHPKVALPKRCAQPPDASGVR